MPAGRVFFDLVEHGDGQARGTERFDRPLRMAGRFEAGVGNEQDAGAAEFAGQLAEAGQCSRRRILPGRAGGSRTVSGRIGGVSS